MLFKDLSYYRVQIKAKNNIKEENVAVDRIYQLNNAKFIKEYGFGITLYEASLMGANISKATKARFDECNKDESYREIGCM